MIRKILVATLLSGALDIVFAMVLTLLFGRQIGDMLRTVASGPFPAATGMGAGGAALGLVVHFALMAIMASVYMAVARNRPQVLAKPIVSGVLYGIVTYFVMNWLVVPLRFGTPLPPKAVSIATQMFAHIVLVGIPMAFIAARYPSVKSDRNPDY